MEWKESEPVLIMDEDSNISVGDEQALELIKESLAEAEAETDYDYDSSVTHVFIILGASVGFFSFSTSFLFSSPWFMKYFPLSVYRVIWPQRRFTQHCGGYFVIS